MAYRTNTDEVAAIIETDCNTDLEPFVKAANVLTDRVAACASDRGITLTTEELRVIEQYLAAHLLTFRDQQYKSKRTERAAASFHGATGTGLESSFYGQTAKILDHSGCLESLDSKSRASLTWLGKPPSEQIDYVDRD